MKYALIQAGQIVRTAEFDTPPPVLPEAKGLAWLELIETPPPEYDLLTNALAPADPLIQDGRCVTRWAVIDLPVETAQANIAAAEARRIADLWQAAHDYEFAQISGSAIGLLTMGVMMGKPKCLSVQNWIKSIWTLYYFRKATGETSTDFSSCGECPHTVPELMAELGL